MKKTYKFITNKREYIIKATNEEEANDIAECMTEDNPSHAIVKRPFEIKED